MYSILGAMNTQVLETTGHSPYELVFGQKPYATIFLRGDGTAIPNEEIQNWMEQCLKVMKIGIIVIGWENLPLTHR